MYLVEYLLGLPDLDVVNRVSCHPAATTDPFQISLIHILKPETTLHIKIEGSL